MMRKRTLWALLILAGGALLLRAASFQLEPGQTAVVTRFGDPRRVVDEPGLSWRWPAPIDQVHILDRRVRVLDRAAWEYLSADKKPVLVDAFLLWRIEQPRLFFERFADPQVAESRLSDLLRSELRNAFTNHPLSDLVSVAEQNTDLRTLAAEVTAAVGGPCRERFGVEVLAVRVKRLNYPATNRRHVVDRMRAERARFAEELRSEGDLEAAKITQDAESQAQARLSEASQQAAEIRGAAAAQVTRIYGEAYDTDPEFAAFQEALKAYAEVFDEGDMVVVPENSFLLRVLRGESALEEASSATRDRDE